MEKDARRIQDKLLLSLHHKQRLPPPPPFLKLSWDGGGKSA